MEPAPPPSRLERWNHFVRWFFNSSPTALIESREVEPLAKGTAARSEKARHGHPRRERRRRSFLHRISTGH